MTTPQYSLKEFLESTTSYALSFSPDGKKVLVAGNETGTSQLYLTDQKGSELEQITFFDENIDFATFSPVKNEIIFGMSVGGNENSQLHLYDVASRTFSKITDKPEVRFGFGGWSKDGQRIAYSSNERNGKDFDVYIMDMQSGDATVVYKEGGWNTSFGFSPSGKYLTVGTSSSIVANQVRIIEIQTGTIFKSFEQKEVFTGRPKWLPDESGFFYTTDLDHEYIVLAFFDMRKSESAFIHEPEWDVEEANLSFDGKYISVVTNEDGFETLVIYRAADFQPITQKNIPKGTSYDSFWARDNNSLAINVSSPTSLLKSWIWSREDDSIVQITAPKSAIPEESHVAPSLIHFESFDGLTVPSLVYEPRTKSDKKMPVIINIHGGPEGQSKATYGPITQYLLQSGYASFLPNVRGSVGYGRTYTHLDDVEKRMDSVADLAALHAYISSQDQYDSDRIILVGGSYGGFMVLAGLAFYPELWAAGVDIVGIANFITFLENTSPYRRALREAEYGSLEHDREFLASVSPFNSIDAIKAPLFIVHGKNDPRVPLSEAEQMLKGLEAKGNEVELKVYDDEGHGISKLKNRLDVWPRIVDFLDTHTRQ